MKKLVIITGLSGSGKSLAANTFEGNQLKELAIEVANGKWELVK